jgi:hypothetical protein
MAARLRIEAVVRGVRVASSVRASAGTLTQTTPEIWEFALNDGQLAEVTVAAGADVFEQRFEVESQGTSLALRRAVHVQQSQLMLGASHTTLATLTVHLSRLRDATDEAARLVQRPAWGDNQLSKFFDFQFIKRGWSPPAPLAFELRDQHAPEIDHLVLEDKRGRPPALFGVSVAREIPLDRVPVVLFLHPMLAQTTALPFGTPYPWDNLYLRILHKYLQLAAQGPPRFRLKAGLPFQIAAAGKAALLVMPLGKKLAGSDDMGDFLKPPHAAELLEEIAALVARRRHVFLRPALGRLAVAGFSSGNSHLVAFLANHRGTRLWSDLLREVYSFDALADGVARKEILPQVIDEIRRWRDAMPAADFGERMARLYYQATPPAVPASWGSWAAGGGHFTTLAHLPPAQWAPLVEAGPSKSTFRKDPIDFVHALISITMLTHAMRNSRFPPGGLP